MKLLSNDAFINEGDDVILQINAEARAKMECGIDVINSSIGSLYDEDGKLDYYVKDGWPSITNVFCNNVDIKENCN